jgi:hypothetical protein
MRIHADRDILRDPAGKGITGGEVTSEPPSFGRLHKVPAKSGWKNEGLGFTPWLAENLDLLGQELGLRLTFRSREYPVGKYYLDLLLEDTQERVVIVENQFGSTDHDHLGKLLTYCAGTDASVVIWIAEALNAEHVAALEWLNENTVAGVGFFGVELELLQIEDSPMAPHFRVRVQPNDWQKAVRPPPGPSTEWTWSAYADQLGISQPRIEVCQALVTALDEEIKSRDLPWVARFRKGYVAFQRQGGYNVVIVDLWWNHPPRLAIKLPRSLQELGVENPYPLLEALWAETEKEHGWIVPSLADVPDVSAAIELVRQYQPLAGPMIQPNGPSSSG